jgi:lycopene cyclase domain-containing protein
VEHLTYLVLLLGWALPVIGLHWLVGAPELRRQLPLLAVAVLAPTAYLSLADATAIGSGVWDISDELTLGWRVGGLVDRAVPLAIGAGAGAAGRPSSTPAERRSTGARLGRRDGRQRRAGRLGCVNNWCACRRFFVYRARDLAP